MDSSEYPEWSVCEHFKCRFHATYAAMVLKSWTTNEDDVSYTAHDCRMGDNVIGIRGSSFLPEKCPYILEQMAAKFKEGDQ